MKSENKRGSLKTNELKNKLTDINKKIILEIKDALWQNPKYKKIITSMDIYEAVLDELPRLKPWYPQATPSASSNRSIHPRLKSWFS